MNKVLAAKIDKVKTLQSGQMFEPKAAPNSEQHTVVFTDPVLEILTETRNYLAEVI